MTKKDLLPQVEFIEIKVKRRKWNWGGRHTLIRLAEELKLAKLVGAL